VIEESCVVAYLYTGRDGSIKSKSKANFDLQRIRADFIKIANTLQQQSESNVAVLYRVEGQASVLNLEMLTTLCGSVPADSVVLQCYVPSKGNHTSYFTFRGYYSLEGNSKPKFRSERIGISFDVTGSTSVQSKTNMDIQSSEVLYLANIVEIF